MAFGYFSSLRFLRAIAVPNPTEHVHGVQIAGKASSQCCFHPSFSVPMMNFNCVFTLSYGISLFVAVRFPLFPLFGCYYSTLCVRSLCWMTAYVCLSVGIYLRRLEVPVHIESSDDVRSPGVHVVGDKQY